jgi:hypothetical protein
MGKWQGTVLTEDAVAEVEAPLGMPVPEGATFKAR